MEGLKGTALACALSLGALAAGCSDQDDDEGYVRDAATMDASTDAGLDGASPDSALDGAGLDAAAGATPEAGSQ